MEENRTIPTRPLGHSERSLHIPTAYENTKAWRKLNKDKVAAQRRRYCERYPDRVKATADKWNRANAELIRERQAAAMRAKRAADPEGQRERMRRFKERREAERVALAGRPRSSRCELCGDEGLTVWDHDHTTGTFRGWICDRCNKALGMVKDDVVLLRAMAAYLEVNDGSPESVSA